jgi:hypothetical protein
MLLYGGRGHQRLLYFVPGPEAQTAHEIFSQNEIYGDDYMADGFCAHCMVGVFKWIM